MWFRYFLLIASHNMLLLYARLCFEIFMEYLFYNLLKFEYL